MSSIKPIKVRPILDSLSHILQHNSSVVRFGDGEIDLILGHSIFYQPYHPELAKRLKEVLQTPSTPELLVCLPDVFEDIDRYNSNAQLFWSKHFEKYADFYNIECLSDWYGSTFLSRPYIDLVDKSQSKIYFEHLRQLWEGQDLLIVEGETSRSGVGNDLFDNTSSISRIICPSKNAFEHYDTILESIKDHSKNRLVILMLGPTAKPLVFDLQKVGIRALDLGHIDSEYEWFKMGATHKVKLSHKHTAEFNRDTDINPIHDGQYHNQIIKKIGVHVMKENKPLISIVIPVYNVREYLERCLDSIAKQTYSNLEVLLINDGSTDGSAQLCEAYAEKDHRFKVFHQENNGVSKARNFAIKEARGDFITFIDSDDFVEDYYIEHLHTALEKNQSDIAVCNFTSFNEERQSFMFFVTSEMYFEKNYSVQEWLDQETHTKHNMNLVFTFSPLKLFKKSLFDGIEYPPYQVREDDATIYKLYLKASKITFINEGIYYYSQRSGSLSRTEMQTDISTMITNAEERIALLSLLGYDTSAHITSYLNRLQKCQKDALANGQIALYRQLSTKLDLYESYQKKN